MAIKSISYKIPQGKIEIDLTGPEGNAFFLLGWAKNFGKSLRMTDAEVDAILEDMRSSDYDHLINVLESNFGEHILLWLP